MKACALFRLRKKQIVKINAADIICSNGLQRFLLSLACSVLSSQITARTLDISNCLVDLNAASAHTHTEVFLCRLRPSVTKGTNKGKDADVGADVAF